VKENELKFFTGNANPQLAEEIAGYVQAPLGKANVSSFPDEEILVEIQENVRGTDAFVIQPTCPPVNNNLMELLIMIDALRRASAWRITAVMPYYGYARQDRKIKPRVPISAKLAANLVTVAGADRVLTMDLHAGQIQGFFDIPVDNLFAAPTLIDYFRKKQIPNLVVVAPDPGGVERARAFAKRLDVPMAIIDKRRTEEREARIMHVVGDVTGKNAVIIDDMIDRAGTMVEAIKGLKENKVKDIYFSATHPVLSDPAMERIEKSGLKEVVVTNTIPLRSDCQSTKITVLSVASLLGEAIKRIHSATSVSSLFV
jgi:ribose-phosphate pyrophosphokinase